MMATDSQMCLEHLKKHYTEVGHPLYFSGISNIFKYYEGCLSIRQIQDFLSASYTYTLHKESNDKWIRNPTFKYYKRYQFQMDLIEIINVSEANDNYKYILTCIDIFTRYAWAKLMRSKKPSETIRCFKEILAEAKGNPRTLMTDKGIIVVFCSCSCACDCIHLFCRWRDSQQIISEVL